MIQKRYFLLNFTLIACFLSHANFIKSAQQVDEEFIRKTAEEKPHSEEQFNHIQEEMRKHLKGDALLVRSAILRYTNRPSLLSLLPVNSPLRIFNPDVHDVNAFIGTLTPLQITHSAYEFNKTIIVTLIKDIQNPYKNYCYNIYPAGCLYEAEEINAFKQKMQWLQKLFKVSFAHTPIAQKFDLEQGDAQQFVEKFPPQQLSTIVNQQIKNDLALIEAVKAYNKKSIKNKEADKGYI